MAGLLYKNSMVIVCVCPALIEAGFFVPKWRVLVLLRTAIAIFAGESE